MNGSMKREISSWLESQGFKYKRDEDFFYMPVGHAALAIGVQQLNRSGFGVIAVYRGVTMGYCQIVCREDVVVNGEVWLDFDESTYSRVIEELCSAISDVVESTISSWTTLLLQASSEVSDEHCKEQFLAEYHRNS